MARKCKPGFKIKDGKCVPKSDNFFRGNIFRPSDNVTKSFLWIALIAIISSALLAAGSFLVGSFGETQIKILLTTVVVMFAGILGLIVGNIRNNNVRVIGLTAIISLALLWLTLIWELFEKLDLEQVLGTTLVIIPAVVFGLSNLANKNQIVKYSGLVASSLAMILWLVFVWNGFDSTENFFKLTLVVSIIAFALAHISLLSLKGSRDNLVRILFYFVLAMIVIVSGMLVYLIFNIETVGENFYRLLGFFAVLDVAGSIALPLFRRVRR